MQSNHTTTKTHKKAAKAPGSTQKPRDKAKPWTRTQDKRTAWN